MTYIMDALCKNEKMVWQQTNSTRKTSTAALAKVTCNDPWALKTRINGHDVDLDILDQF